MYNKTTLLACAASLVGFRADSNSLYSELYNIAQAAAGSGMAFDSATKTITWTGGNFETEGFELGDSITITLSTSNNATKTISAITGNVITTTQALVNENSTTAKITSIGALQESTSDLYVNDLPSVTFEIINACLSPDVTIKSYLTSVFESEFYSLMNKFVAKSKQNYNSKELLSNYSIVSGVASMNNRVVQNKRFVGYWFRPHRSNFLKSQITQLGFQGVTLQNGLKIFLYETSQLEPIATFNIDITKSMSLEWTTINNAILSWESETGGTGQDYMLGYYEADAANPQSYQLQGQALYLQFDCGGCPGSPKKMYGKYLGVQPIEIPNDKLNWNEAEQEYFIPLVDNVSDYVSSTTHGLLAKVNVTCDISDVICQNIQIFAPSLQHAIATRILYDAYASNRINSVADSKRDQVRQFAVKYDGILNGYTTPAPDSVKFKGLVDTLTVDFSSLDNYCLPCAEGVTKGYLVR